MSEAGYGQDGHGIAIRHLLAVAGLELFRAVSPGLLVTSRYKSSWEKARHHNVRGYDARRLSTSLKTTARFGGWPAPPAETGLPRERERRRPLDSQGPTAPSAQSQMPSIRASAECRL